MNKKLLFLVVPFLLLTSCTAKAGTSSVTESVGSATASSVESSSVLSSASENAKMTKVELATTFGDIADEGLEKLGLKSAIAAPKTRAFPVDGEALTDPTNSEYKAVLGNMGSCFCMVQLLSDLCKRDEFVVTDEIIKTHFTYAAANMEFDYFFLPKIDVENNKVVVEIEVMSQNSVSLYAYMDINYDFATSTLTSYHLGVINSGSYQNQSFDEEGKIYSSINDKVSSEFKTALDSFKVTFENKMASAVTLAGNFDIEFTTYMTNGQAIFMAAMA